MGLLGGIKRWSAKRSLRKKATVERKRRQVVNFHRAQKVGLLFESTSEHMFILIKKYVAYLREEHGINNVKALGFVDGKEEPIYHRHDLFFDYFTKKEITWNGQPKSDAVRNFVEEDYDILIDCTKGECTPLNFVAVDSKAAFKVGRIGDFDDHYDLVIQLDENSTFDKYVAQVNHFLSNINHNAA